MTELKLPCILINNDNFIKWWPSITRCIRESDFVSLDLELSGLGSKDINAPIIDERYEALKEVVTSRAVLSMGIACFKIDSTRGFACKDKLKSKSDHETVAYEQIMDCLESGDSMLVNLCSDEKKDQDFYVTINVFNFLTLNLNEFVLETRSMKFLVQQGFDFNELASKGIPFYSGNDIGISDDTTSPSLRNLITLLIQCKLPIIFHNGLLDLAFIYHNFYAQIPKKLEEFLSDLVDMFPNGIFDTKLIGNFFLSNSYLEYLFNFSLRNNYFNKLQNFPSINLILDHDQYDLKLSGDIKYCDLSSKIFQSSSDSIKVCDNYAKYGWCEKFDMCEHSHNIDLILDEELRSRKGKKSKNLVKLLKQRLEAEEENRQKGSLNTDNNNYEPQSQSVPFKKGGLHHSGNDAFMTGYYFMYYLISEYKLKSYSDFGKFCRNNSKFTNRVFLSGKPQPLLIMKSQFAKNSKNHTKKMSSFKTATTTKTDKSK